jgi:hypothetical protein
VFSSIHMSIHVLTSVRLSVHVAFCPTVQSRCFLSDCPVTLLFVRLSSYVAFCPTIQSRFRLSECPFSSFRLSDQSHVRIYATVHSHVPCNRLSIHIFTIVRPSVHTFLSDCIRVSYHRKYSEIFNDALNAAVC